MDKRILPQITIYTKCTKKMEENNMSNMMNQNSIVMNRPVTIRDIAAALHMNPSTVSVYLTENSVTKNGRFSPAMIKVREYAKKVGYDPYVARAYNKDHQKEMKEHVKNTQLTTYYRGGNFHTKDEEVTRMKELREEGYSNAEIAQKIGRSIYNVWKKIGPQDPELSKQNVAMAAHIRAQKNAARKQYVLNKPIREYNAKVEKHNKMKAELAMIQVELLSEKSSIEKVSQTKISFPLVDLKTLQPTPLQ